VWVSGVADRRRDRALTVYGLSLAADVLWPILFFTVQAWLAAFLLLLLLWALVGIAALLFGAITPRAGKLLLPYLAWLTFAAYLNLGVWLLNR
jgi:tryptophan-rich sensory protein